MTLTDFLNESLSNCKYDSKIVKELGRGEEGVTYLLSDGNVLKKYFRPLPLRVQLVAKASAFRKMEGFAPILDFGPSYTVRAYLKTMTKKCKDIYKDIMGSQKTDKVKAILYEADELHMTGDLDIKLSNFGEDENGEVFMFDY